MHGFGRAFFCIIPPLGYSTPSGLKDLERWQRYKNATPSGLEDFEP